MGLPKLIFFALIIFAGWYVYRKFVNDAMKRSKAAELKRMTDEMKAFDERYTKAGEARANKQASQ